MPPKENGKETNHATRHYRDRTDNNVYNTYFFSFVALLIVMNLKQSISSEKIDEGAARSSSWLTAANMDMLV